MELLQHQRLSHMPIRLYIATEIAKCIIANNIQEARENAADLIEGCMAWADLLIETHEEMGDNCYTADKPKGKPRGPVEKRRRSQK